ncbi:site-specific integrase [Paraburkholderia sp. BCC1885]|uniref:site-specific integrase n=1 Tax=Paraburkholderia sp. BCC1885 TaxID=2562669 RepID=UPI0011831202|nr:site-specific integrase [Paraburkholderia sp. BCC1885]
MSKPFRRGNRYFIRRHIPLDLRPLYPGKLELVRALGTSDYRQAVQLCAAQDVAFNEQFAHDRSTLHFHQEWLDSIRVEVTDPADDHISTEEAVGIIMKQRDAFIASRLAEARVALGIDSKPAVAAVPPAPTPIPVSSEQKTTAPTIKQANGTRSLDALIEIWEKARTPEIPVVNAYKRTVLRFKEIIGDIPVRQIAKAQIITFKDTLPTKDVSIGVTRQAVGHLNALFNIAIGEDWRTDNPCKGVRVYEENPDNLKSAEEARPPFDIQTLNNLFASPIYQPGYVATTDNEGGVAAYWLPLLGLFTGARVEELAQLRPTDVFEESYYDNTGAECKAWVVQIVEDATDGLSVKNKHSIRRLPLHSELINRGFVEFVKSQTGKKRIFDKLVSDKYGRESSPYAQWFTRYLRRDCKPTSPKMTFHSFRHTSKDIMRNCRIGKDERDAIHGHAEKGQAGEYGGTFYPLAPLVDALNKYVIHGVNLPGVPYTSIITAAAKPKRAKPAVQVDFKNSVMMF